MAAGTTVISPNYKEHSPSVIPHNADPSAHNSTKTMDDHKPLNGTSPLMDTPTKAGPLPMEGTGIGLFGYDGGTPAHESTDGKPGPVDPKVCFMCSLMSVYHWKMHVLFD